MEVTISRIAKLDVGVGIYDNMSSLRIALVFFDFLLDRSGVIIGLGIPFVGVVIFSYVK